MSTVRDSLVEEGKCNCRALWAASWADQKTPMFLDVLEHFRVETEVKKVEASAEEPCLPVKMAVERITS
jgi:hypothetical protein